MFPSIRTGRSVLQNQNPPQLPAAAGPGSGRGVRGPGNELSGNEARSGQLFHPLPHLDQQNTKNYCEAGPPFRTPPEPPLTAPSQHPRLRGCQRSPAQLTGPARASNRTGPLRSRPVSPGKRAQNRTVWGCGAHSGTGPEEFEK